MASKPRYLLWGGLTRKLLLGFGGAIVILIVVAMLLAGLLTSAGSELRKVHGENYDSVRYCDGMRNALDEAQGVVLVNPPFPGGAGAKLEQARKDFETNAKAQLANITLPHEPELSTDAVDSGREVFKQVGRLLAGGSAIGDPQVFFRENIFPVEQRCQQDLTEVSQINLENLVGVNKQVQDALLATRTTIIILLIIGLVLSVLFIMLTAREMIRPLMKLTHSVRQIEAGNLDLIVEAESHDEIGELALAFNAMAARLREFRRMDLERLLRTQQTTQTAIDSLPDAVAVLNLKGEIEISNRAAQVHFKLLPGARIQAVRPDWSATFFEPVIATRQSVVPDGYRSAIQLFDESGERFLLPRAEPMFDGQRELIGVTLVLVEITHLHKADEFKSGLLSAVSHELKTPLTSVRMAMRMLQDKRIGELNPRQQTLLAAARLDSERVVRTVEDILTIGRVEAGRARLDMSQVSAEEIVRRALAAVEMAAGERNIRIEQQLPQATLETVADVNLVACALTNLIANAVKFSPVGSVVTIRVSGDGKGMEIAVLDQGPGIAEEYRGRIFEKFFRIPTPGGPTGAGLGLSIAAEIR